MLFRSSVERHRSRMDVRAFDIHFAQCCEHPGSQLPFVWLHCGLACWTRLCFVFLKTVTGKIAVRSREDVDVLGSVQYHLLLYPAREQPEGTSFSS